MANCRLERIGTIFSRVSGLIRAGAAKLEDKPLWYDVYQHFPPKYPPKFDRIVPSVPVRAIFYPEDVLRAKIHKEKATVVGVVNLSDKTQVTNTQRCIALSQELQENTPDRNEDELLEQVIEQVAAERSIRREQSKEKTSIATEFKRAKSLNIVDILKES